MDGVSGGETAGSGSGAAPPLRRRVYAGGQCTEGDPRAGAGSGDVVEPETRGGVEEGAALLLGCGVLYGIVAVVGNAQVGSGDNREMLVIDTEQPFRPCSRK